MGVLLTSNQATALQSKILVLGDSLTAGYRLLKTEAYPALLTQSFQKEGLDAEFINAGVSGDTSAQANRRLDWTLKKLGPFKAAVVWIGYNDIFRQLPVSDTEKNIDQILKRLSDEKIPIYLLGVKVPLNYSSSYRQAFEKIHPSMAKKYKVPLDPFTLEPVALKTADNLDDGIHPNPQGHRKLHDRIAAFLKANGILKILKN